MNIAILQLNIEQAGSIDEICRHSIANADAAIKKAGNMDLFILPELFSTGGFLPLSKLSEQFPNRTEMLKLVNGIKDMALHWMKAKSKSTGAAICGSMICEENDKFFNRLYFVEPDGLISTYDKRHLFRGAGEEKIFSLGKKRMVVRFRGMRFLLQICYDLRFPAFSRCRNDYDAIIYVANWPECRKEAWTTLLRARAIENQSFVMGCNCAGHDGVSNYGGASCVFDACGHALSTGSGSKADIIKASIDVSQVASFRKKFPVHTDADAFVIIDTDIQSDQDICQSNKKHTNNTY